MSSTTSGPTGSATPTPPPGLGFSSAPAGPSATTTTSPAWTAPAAASFSWEQQQKSPFTPLYFFAVRGRVFHTGLRVQYIYRREIQADTELVRASITQRAGLRLKFKARMAREKIRAPGHMQSQWRASLDIDRRTHKKDTTKLWMMWRTRCSTTQLGGDPGACVRTGALRRLVSVAV